MMTNTSKQPDEPKREINGFSVIRRIMSNNCKLFWENESIRCLRDACLVIAAATIILVIVSLFTIFSFELSPKVAAWVHFILFINRESSCFTMQEDSCYLLGMLYEIVIIFLIYFIGIMIGLKIYKATRKELEEDAVARMA